MTTIARLCDGLGAFFVEGYSQEFLFEVVRPIPGVPTVFAIALDSDFHNAIRATATTRHDYQSRGKGETKSGVLSREVGGGLIMTRR